MNEFVEGSDLGGGDSSAAPEDNAAVTPAVEDSGAPKTMLEAIEAAVPSQEAKPAETADKPADPAAEVKQDAPEDLTKMPEGLTPKAQERFQMLANTNKELTARLEQTVQAVEPFRESLQQNGVTKEQFSHATGYIGMINNGNLEGALKVLDEERRLISLAIGKPLPGVDALSQFPDLRNAVDSFQISEEAAMEIARGRANQNATQQHQQQQRTQQEQTQRVEQETNSGTQAVDDFCKRMMASDLDYAKVESILLPQIQAGLLNGVPPNRWASVVESTYKMIKTSAGSAKGNVSTPALRPTGSASPATAPKSMMEAMFPGG